MRLPNQTFIDRLTEIKPTILIHCAGSSSISESVEDPLTDFQKNVGITAYVLDVIRRVAPNCKFITLSSAAVYGNPLNLPVAESAQCSPISPYGVHKLIAENLIENYSRLYGISYAILRVFSAYGTGLKKQVIYDLCKKITNTKSDYIDVIGTGSESRDFIHVYDICRAIEIVAHNDITGTLNLGSGTQTTVLELVSLLRKHFNSSKPIRFTGHIRSGDPHNWQADISEFTRLGFMNITPLEVGLREYCDWYGREFTVF